jgi:hypothetical protein
MARIAIFGTSHRLQGAANGRMNVDEPSYSDLLTMLFREEKPDFVFEEAAGLGQLSTAGEQRLTAQLALQNLEAIQKFERSSGN